jgi:hypothetical protein
MATFTTPFILERPDTGNRLIDTRCKVPRGQTVLKNPDNSYTTVAYPSQDQIAAAQIAYVGGHVYTVSTAEAAALTAAGFGQWIN